AMHADTQGILWVAARGGRVVRRINGRFEPVPLPASFTGSAIDAIASDRRGTVWMYGNRRLLAIRANSREPTIVQHLPPMPGTTVRCLFADRGDRLWLAGDGARLAVYDHGTFRLFTEAHGVPLGKPSGIYEDGSSRIWVSSDSGLSTIHNDRMVTLTTANGLP